MTELELQQLNYTNGCNNYIVRGEASNHWVGFSELIIGKLKNKFGENFNLIIYWHNKSNDIEYLFIPYTDIKHLLVHNTTQRRWHFTIKDEMLRYNNNSNYAIEISKYTNNIFVDNIIFTDADESAEEGDAKLMSHYKKERSQALIRKFKKYIASTDCNLHCKICGFSFSEQFGTFGNGFIEVHHTFPIAERSGSTRTTFNDLIPVCPNCHAMLHRRTDGRYLSIEELRTLVQQNKGKRE